MKTYAKLEAGALRMMGRVPNISNPTEAQVAAYAAAHGFKELVETPAPGRYYRKGYAETEDAITETWVPWELEAAKKDALEGELQSRRNAAMFGVGGEGVVIPCSALPNGVLFNAEAHNMVNSLMLLQAQGSLPDDAEWTDAADVAHAVTPTLIAALVQAMMGHIQAVQAKYKPARDAVNAAEDVDEVEAALELAETLAAN